LGFVSEGELEREMVVESVPDKAGPEAESDPDGGTTDEGATAPLLEAGAAPLLEAGTGTLLETTTTPLLEAATPPLLEAATPPLLEAATPPLLEAATPPLLEAGTGPLLEAGIGPLLEAGIGPELLLGRRLEAGTEALRVAVAENVELAHWCRDTRLKAASTTKANNPGKSGLYVTSHGSIFEAFAVPAMAQVVKSGCPS
jgi:hypothetical protein